MIVWMKSINYAVKSPHEEFFGLVCLRWYYTKAKGNTRINLPTSSISHFWVLKIFWICFCFPYKALQSSCGVTYIYIPYLLSLNGTSRSNKVCLTQPSNVYCVSFSLFTNFLFCILLYSKFLLSGLTIMYSCLLRSMASLQKCSWI